MDGEPSPGDGLDVDLLREAVAESKPLGLNHARLTGGEPTLHPRFVEMVDMLTAEGLRLDMETNGTLIDANLTRHLKEETSLQFVLVSLDGAPVPRRTTASVACLAPSRPPWVAWAIWWTQATSRR